MTPATANAKRDGRDRAVTSECLAQTAASREADQDTSEALLGEMTVQTPASATAAKDTVDRPANREFRAPTHATTGVRREGPWLEIMTEPAVVNALTGSREVPVPRECRAPTRVTTEVGAATCRTTAADATATATGGTTTATAGSTTRTEAANRAALADGVTTRRLTMAAAQASGLVEETGSGVTRGVVRT